MAEPLSLQGLELDIETPADVYRSDNSIYACVATGAHPALHRNNPHVLPVHHNRERR